MSRFFTYLRERGQKLGLGRLYYRLLHKPPLGLLRTWNRQGYACTWNWRLGRKQMESAIAQLATTDRKRAPGDGYPVHYLTGRGHFLMTAYCYLSLRHYSGVAVHPVIHDDGTLDQAVRQRLTSLFPEAVIVGAEEAEIRLDKHLPRDQYPTLRACRDAFPLYRKLFDIHAGGTGWKLYLDSDMLFFARPDFLLGWLRAPERPLCMRDVHSTYGYSPTLLQEIFGKSIPEKANAGICGLKSDDINWNDVEQWCRALVQREGMNHFLEQTLTAALMGSLISYTPTPDYRIVQTASEAAASIPATLKHYTAWSRPYYYYHAWREWNKN